MDKFISGNTKYLHILNDIRLIYLIYTFV